jgi:glycosyltransferase involved in cell wall biosynthesis
MRGVCFFGGYVKKYPRSVILRKGLGKIGVPVTSCHAHHKRHLPSRYAVLLVRYLFRKRNFSVIYVPEFRHKDVPLAWFLAKLTGKRIVFDPLVSRYDTKVRDRGDAKERSMQAWHNRNIDRLSLSLPDLVLADTKAHADYYVGELGASGEKVRVLPVGFDEDLFTSRRQGEEAANGKESGGKPLKVLFFGNYLPLHGIPTIVRAANLLRSRSDIQFELIGDGQTYMEVKTLVERERIQNVRLSARIAMESLPDKIRSASICLGIFGRTDKASRVIPNKVYQCMAMEKAVITARSPAILERFSDGDGICLVPPGSGEELAEKINHLADHPEERERIGGRAYQLVHDRFHSRRIAEMFLAYLGETGNEPRRQNG